MMTGLDRATFCKAWSGILYMLGGQGRIQTDATDANDRSEFHVNLIPPSQVSIKTPKNNNINILISKRVRVGPIVVFQSVILWIKTMISNEENFASPFASRFLFIVFLLIYIANIIASGCCQKCLDIIVLTLHF